MTKHSLPLNHSLGKVLTLLRQSPWSYTEHGGMLSIHTDDRALSPLVSALIGVLSSVEQTDARVIFEPDGKTMELADYFEACSLHDFGAKAQSGWLLRILREERLTAHFQPIVHSESQQVSPMSA